jgi:hypothetical protein
MPHDDRGRAQGSVQGLPRVPRFPADGQGLVSKVPPWHHGVARQARRLSVLSQASPGRIRGRNVRKLSCGGGWDGARLGRCGAQELRDVPPRAQPQRNPSLRLVPRERHRGGLRLEALLHAVPPSPSSPRRVVEPLLHLSRGDRRRCQGKGAAPRELRVVPQASSLRTTVLYVLPQRHGKPRVARQVRPQELHGLSRHPRLPSRYQVHLHDLPPGQEGPSP